MPILFNKMAYLNVLSFATLAGITCRQEKISSKIPSPPFIRFPGISLPGFKAAVNNLEVVLFDVSRAMQTNIWRLSQRHCGSWAAANAIQDSLRPVIAFAAYNQDRQPNFFQLVA